MDATAHLNTAVPLLWQYYLPATGDPYAPTPPPTGLAFVVDEDGIYTSLVDPGTALTEIVGLIGAYTYILDPSLNVELGQIVGQAVTTDPALTPYANYATRNYVVQVEEDSSASGVWSFLVSSLGDSTTIGGFIYAILTAIYNLLLGAASIEVNDDFDSEGNLHLTKYQTYSAALNNRPTLTVSVLTDPSSATARWTFLQNSVATPFAAELISYDPDANTAVYGLTLTSAQTGELTAKEGGRDTASFSLSVFLGSVNVLVPVAYPNGKLIVSDAPAPPTS